MEATPEIELRTRPRQARSVATFNQILDAAAEVLASRGFGSLTTNAVADSAGVTIRAIYRYFPNKHALVAELARRMSARWQADLSALAHPGGRLADRWAAYLDVFVTSVEATPGGRAVLLAMRSDPVLAQIDEEANRAYIDGVTAALFDEMPHLDRTWAAAVATVLIRSTVAVIDELFEREQSAERQALLDALATMHRALLDRLGAGTEPSAAHAFPSAGPSATVALTLVGSEHDDRSNR